MGDDLAKVSGHLVQLLSVIIVLRNRFFVRYDHLAALFLLRFQLCQFIGIVSDVTDDECRVIPSSSLGIPALL